MWRRREGFELDIITMVLGGVSISAALKRRRRPATILLILNLRNGMSLVNITSNNDRRLGVLLILSVLLPNWGQDARSLRNRRRRVAPANNGRTAHGSRRFARANQE